MWLGSVCYRVQAARNGREALEARQNDVPCITFKTETHQANISPLDFSITDKERVNVPVWVGVAFTVVGAGLLLKVDH